MRYLTFKSFNNENKQLKVRRDFTLRAINY